MNSKYEELAKVKYTQRKKAKKTKKQNPDSKKIKELKYFISQGVFQRFSKNEMMCIIRNRKEFGKLPWMLEEYLSNLKDSIRIQHENQKNKQEHSKKVRKLVEEERNNELSQMRKRLSTESTDEIIPAKRSKNYSNPTIADDGITYRSKFEAEFVNKLLYPSGLEYVYEKAYSDKSKHTCDFHIPLYDIWIECVYNSYSIKYEYESMPFNSEVILNVKYEQKNYAKKLGAKWCAMRKTWYALNPINTGLHGFMNESYLSTTLVIDGSEIRDGYYINLFKKILNNKSDVIVFTNKDLKKFDTFGEMVIDKGTSKVSKMIALTTLENHRIQNV
jgi:hypothetical protein